MSAEPTEHCQRPGRCPTPDAVPVGGCRGLQRCAAAVVLRRTATKDGRSNHWAYGLYKDMNFRCANRSSYRRHGIQVHPPWVSEPWMFFKFMDEDMPPRPPDMFMSPKGTLLHVYTLDRVDPRGDYEPGNLRWLDRAGQNGNKVDASSPPERGFERWASCLCPWSVRQECPCKDARADRAGTVVRNEEVEPWPPGADVPDSDVCRAPFGPPVVLGQITGDVELNRFGEPRISEVKHVMFPAELWVPVQPAERPDLHALLQDDAVDFSDLLGDGGPSLSDLLDDDG